VQPPAAEIAFEAIEPRADLRNVELQTGRRAGQPAMLDYCTENTYRFQKVHDDGRRRAERT
jgi:hypothetical protein